MSMSSPLSWTGLITHLGETMRECKVAGAQAGVMVTKDLRHDDFIE
jgi:hypothetical protein